MYIYIYRFFYYTYICICFFFLEALKAMASHLATDFLQMCRQATTTRHLQNRSFAGIDFTLTVRLPLYRNPLQQRDRPSFTTAVRRPTRFHLRPLQPLQPARPSGEPASSLHPLSHSRGRFLLPVSSAPSAACCSSLATSASPCRAAMCPGVSPAALRLLTVASARHSNRSATCIA